MHIMSQMALKTQSKPKVVKKNKAFFKLINLPTGTCENQVKKDSSSGAELLPAERGLSDTLAAHGCDSLAHCFRRNT